MINKYFLKMNEQARDKAGETGRLKPDVRGLACHTQGLGCGPRRRDGPGEVAALMAARLTVRMTGGESS